MDVILFNAILYTITLLIFLLKFRKINIVICIWTFYTILAWMGIVALETEAYKFALKNMFHVRLLPYILYYVFNLVVCSPFFFVLLRRLILVLFQRLSLNSLLSL